MRYLTLLLLLLVLSSCGSDGTNTGSEGSSGSGAKDSGAGTPRASAAPPEWRKLTESPLWSGRFGHQVVLKDGAFYLFGGNSSIPGKSSTELSLAIWSSTDGKKWKWINFKGLRWGPRYGHQVVVKEDGTFFLFGGKEGTPRKNDVWKSTDNGESWEEVSAHDLDPKGNKWTPRYGHQVVVKKVDRVETFFLFGGLGPSGIRQDDVWKSTNGTVWTRVIEHAKWSPRDGHQVEVKGDIIYLFGGHASAPKNDVWKSTDNGESWEEVSAHDLDPKGNKWTPRKGHQVVVKGDEFYLLGGNDGSSDKNDVWSSSNGATWTEVSAGGAASESQWSARSGHQVEVKGDSIYLFGGFEKGSRKNDVWVYE